MCFEKRPPFTLITTPNSVDKYLFDQSLQLPTKPLQIIIASVNTLWRPSSPRDHSISLFSEWTVPGTVAQTFFNSLLFLTIKIVNLNSKAIFSERKWYSVCIRPLSFTFQFNKDRKNKFSRVSIFLNWNENLQTTCLISQHIFIPRGIDGITLDTSI